MYGDAVDSMWPSLTGQNRPSAVDKVEKTTKPTIEGLEGQDHRRRPKMLEMDADVTDVRGEHNRTQRPHTC